MYLYTEYEPRVKGELCSRNIVFTDNIGILTTFATLATRGIDWSA